MLTNLRCAWRLFSASAAQLNVTPFVIRLLDHSALTFFALAEASKTIVHGILDFLGRERRRRPAVARPILVPGRLIQARPERRVVQEHLGQDRRHAADDLLLDAGLLV